MKSLKHPTSSGTVESVRGSIVDVLFEKDFPSIHTVLPAGKDEEIVIEVLAQRDAWHVRGIALTQPFFTTEQFTGMKGKLVKLADSLDGCERILNDGFKDYPGRARST